MSGAALPETTGWFGRLGLLGRLVLILAVAFALLQVAMFGLWWWLRDADPGEGRLPLAQQVLALATLLDRVPQADRPLVLRATAANGLPARIQPGPLEPEAGETAMPGLGRILGRELVRQGLGARAPVVLYDRDADPALRGVRRFRVGVTLASGETLVVQGQERLTPRVLGLPAGLIGGMLGISVAVLAVLALVRETKPLRRLARAVEGIGAGPPVALPEQGTREVRGLIRAINAMQARITGLLDSRTFILGSLSHDLRTYLTRLRLRVEMLPEGTARERAVRDVEGMQKLVEESLDFAGATLDAGGRGPVDLAALVRTCVEARDERQRPAVAALPPGVVLVAMGEPAARRVLDNLLDNAIAYGTQATISLALDGARAVLLVDDAGPGIPPAERARVFDPFVRLDPSRNRGHGGTGLGLAIVKQILDLHGGQVTLGDAPGGGLRAAVSLPLAPASR
ncbi:ATP-binding protein [Zavarzinia sp. CC-PAN008]|uniref:ATP-binding protein n=1 Tax=Zavarzinia sp. CC-PAN008 TaxID=3243332 RepID=UPI003F748BCE